MGKNDFYVVVPGGKPDSLVFGLHVGELVSPESGGQDGIDWDQDDHDGQAGERGDPEVPEQEVEGQSDR